MMNFIDDSYIRELLRAPAADNEIDAILEKAEHFKGLKHQEVAALFATSNTGHIDRIFKIAGRIKNHIYGDRIVLFAPLYVSDYCINRCAYCGFRNDNSQKRRKLTQNEIKTEVEILQKMGHKRLAMEAGEDPENCPLDYILESIGTVYENSDIRRVNINIAALDTSGFRRLKDAQIGTYILFQETYHRPTYEKFHISGPKSDYCYHLTAFDRAMEAGIDDVGAGALFGLYDHRYEALALMIHNEHLENKFGVGFHTISVPRIRDAGGAESFVGVSDSDFMKLVAILRIAVPFTGMIISTRETPEMRRKLIKIGISQMSAGSRAAVGGYSVPDSGGYSASEQFSLADHREAREIIYWLMEEGVLPSFCTACYRKGRSGDRFMELAKKGSIKTVCLPNSLLTLKEYALDYGDERFNALADTLIADKLSQVDDREKIQFDLSRLAQGERDLFV